MWYSSCYPKANTFSLSLSYPIALWVGETHTYHDVNNNNNSNNNSTSKLQQLVKITRTKMCVFFWLSDWEAFPAVIRIHYRDQRSHNEQYNCNSEHVCSMRIIKQISRVECSDKSIGLFFECYRWLCSQL